MTSHLHIPLTSHRLRTTYAYTSRRHTKGIHLSIWGSKQLGSVRATGNDLPKIGYAVRWNNRDVGNRAQRVKHENQVPSLCSIWPPCLICFPVTRVGDRSPEHWGRVWYISIICCKHTPWTWEHPAWSSTIRITINTLHTDMSIFWEKKRVPSFWFQEYRYKNIIDADIF